MKKKTLKSPWKKRMKKPEGNGKENAKAIIKTEGREGVSLSSFTLVQFYAHEGYTFQLGFVSTFVQSKVNEAHMTKQEKGIQKDQRSVVTGNNRGCRDEYYMIQEISCVLKIKLNNNGSNVNLYNFWVIGDTSIVAHLCT
jgi:hypothetical protein